jgi:hypothetical protein
VVDTIHRRLRGPSVHKASQAISSGSAFAWGRRRGRVFREEPVLVLAFPKCCRRLRARPPVIAAGLAGIPKAILDSVSAMDGILRGRMQQAVDAAVDGHVVIAIDAASPASGASGLLAAIAFSRDFPGPLNRNRFVAVGLPGLTTFSDMLGLSWASRSP